MPGAGAWSRRRAGGGGQGREQAVSAAVYTASVWTFTVQVFQLLWMFENFYNMILMGKSRKVTLTAALKTPSYYEVHPEPHVSWRASNPWTPTPDLCEG